MNRVGHAFIKRRMREENAIFGGEVTGHYYFRDNFYADNGFIPALLILELMSKKGMSLHDLLKPLREQVLHLRRDQHQGARTWTSSPTKIERAEKHYARRQRLRARRRVGGVPRLALQRPAVEHRAAAAPESRRPDAGDHGKAARRGARDHPRLAMPRTVALSAVVVVLGTGFAGHAAVLRQPAAIVPLTTTTSPAGANSAQPNCPCPIAACSSAGSSRRAPPPP